MNQAQFINNIIVDNEYGIKEISQSNELFLRRNYINPNLTKKAVNNSFDGKRPDSVAIVGCTNTSLSDGKMKHPFWTAHDAEENYLSSKPTCFLILGKEGCGSTELGERLAQHWKCIHLNPEKLISDEIEQGSLTGKCMDFNMRHNKPLTSDMLLTILSEKLKSPVVKHRGYVLTGFPVVNTTEKVAELQASYYSEWALSIAFEIIDEIISICTLVKPKKKPRTSEIGEEENLEEDASIPEEIEDEMPDNEENADFEKDKITLQDLQKMSSLEACEDIIKKGTKTSLIGLKTSISKQLFHIFNLSLVPDVVIYVSCPDEDIVTKQDHSNISYPHMNEVTLPFTSPSKSIPDIRWPTKYNTEEKLEIPKALLIDNPKYHTKIPSHFTKPVLFQMCNYNKFVLPLIDNEFAKYDPNFIIKVDGRYSVDGMLESVLVRLTNLPVTPTLVPTTLLKYMQDTLLDYAENDGENPIPDDFAEFWNFVESLTPFHLPSSIQFNLSSSLWHNKCPVQLSLGKITNGKTKFAVIMFNNVYLLSTKEHLIEFCKNPRKYLKLEHLKLTCRIFILGTKSSGKSLVADFLKWLLDGEIVRFNNVVDEVKSEKFTAYATSIFDLISPTLEQQRLSEWQAKETVRNDELNQFLDNRVQAAEEYVKLYETALVEKREALEEKRKTVGEYGQDNFSGEDEYVSEEETYSELDLCRNILEDRANALSVAPHNLTEVLPKPPPPQIGDEDTNQLVTKYIADNDTLDEVTPTPEEVIKALNIVIKTIEEDTIRKTNGKFQYGRWIVDGFSPSSEYWQVLMESEIMPDEVVCLVEDRDIDEESFRASYKLITNQISPQQYVGVKDPLVQLKLNRSLNISEIKQVQSTAEQSEDPLDDFKQDEDEMNKLENAISELNESISEFREQWETSKAMLEERSKLPIEIMFGEMDIFQRMSEVIRLLRIHMNKPCEPYEAGEQSEDQDDLGSEHSDNETKFIKEDNRFLGDVGLFCPVTYLNYGVLWKGKSEFALKFDNKIYFCSSEKNMEKFRADPTRFLGASNPYKQLPPPRICVVGGQGVGRSSVSKFIAEELGIFHIDFSFIINKIILPPHFKKVGRQFENDFTDNLLQANEGEEEAERVEDEEADDSSSLLKNEKLFRRRVYDYFEQGTPLPKEILRNAIKQLWFSEPYSSRGFVLDGFPLLPSDVEAMISTCAIPDFVIELSAETETVMSRSFQTMFRRWKEQQDAAMNMNDRKFKLIHDKWRNTVENSVVAQLLIKEIESKVLQTIDPSSDTKIVKEEEELTDNIRSKDNLTDSEEVDNLYEDAVANNPEPIDTSEWESVEDAEARIESRIDNVHQIQVDNLKDVQEIFAENQIDWFSVDAAMPLTKVIKKCYLHTSSLSKRNASFFEQTYLLSGELSEYLISKGFIFQNKFRRYCPVHIAEKPKCMLNMYKAFQKNENLYHVLYRNHVYFLWGMENLKKFRSDPLKYVTCENIDSFTAFPLKLAIVGPPKSGKSILTARFVKFYNVKPISRGQAIRQVLGRFGWIALAKKIHNVLSSGDALTPELIVKAVQLVSTCPETFAQGFVYDGFPSNACETDELVKAGIYPFFIMDLTADKESILKFSLGDSHYHIHRLPLYSQLLLVSRFEVWLSTRQNLRNWIKAEFQNDQVISADQSRWQVWITSNQIVQSGVEDIGSYILNVAYRPVPLKSMCISTKEFVKRSSNVKGFCPVCLLVNRIRYSHNLTDRNGLLQYRGLFYWLCEEHKEVFCASPQFYLGSVKELALPSEIATPVEFYEPESLYESGWCIVDYFEHLPQQIMTKGKSDYAMRYKEHVYLFCCTSCQKKFAEKPFKYSSIEVLKKKFSIPEISLKTLPPIGYLEQTLSRVLTDGCFNVAMLRPVYPGLSVAQSALLHVALYLKINNPLTSKEARTLYIQANTVYEERCRRRERASKFLRSMDNPFLQKTKCCHPMPSLDSGTVEKLTSARDGSSDTFDMVLVLSSMLTPFESKPSHLLDPRRVPVPDDRFDYLCEYHKPLSKVPAFLNVVDIAGLVKGAAEGQGLGNAFLSHIKACDTIFNLCRAFDDENVIHVDGEVNPVRDLETIGEELRLKDEEQIVQNLDKVERAVARGGDKKLKPEYDALVKIKGVLVDEKKHIRFGDWTTNEIEIMNRYLFLTSKPALYLVNLSEKDYIRKKNKWLPKLKEWVDKNDPGALLIPFSGALETKLLDMEPDERAAYLKEQNVTSALDKIIVNGYKALQLEYFFTAGPDEVKAWTIQKGTKAPQAAGRIHTDFEKGFIMAEVMHYKDFKEEGSEAAAKSAGKYRQQGRNYTVEDGDIIFFKFNAGAGLKDAKKK